MKKYLYYFLIIIFWVDINVCKPARPEALPKIIWTYLEPNENNLIHELSVAKMQNIFEKTRWILYIITPENIFMYIKDHESFKQMLRSYPREL